MRSYSKHQLCVCALCMLWCEHNFSRWIGEITPHRTTTVLKSLMSTCANGASLQKRHRTHKIRTITNEQGVRHLLTTQKSCERWWWWWCWRLVVGGCWSNRAINNIIIVPFHFLYHFKAIKYKCMILYHATFFLITCSMYLDWKDLTEFRMHTQRNPWLNNWVISLRYRAFFISERKPYNSCPHWKVRKKI